MDKDFLKTWSEYLFRAIQPEYDGGIFSIFDRENETAYLQQTSTYLDWAKSLVFKPYFNVLIGLTLLWSLLLLIAVIVILIRLCCRKLDCCHTCNQNVKKILDAISRECLNKKLPSDFCICAKKKSVSFSGDLTDRAMFVTVVVLICGLIAGIYYSVRSSSDFQNSLEESNSSYTLITSLDQTINQFDFFLTNGISTGNITTIEMISNFNRYFSKELDDLVYDLSDYLLNCYGVLPTLKQADDVIFHIDNIFVAMNHITNNRGALFARINSFLGTVKDFLKSFLLNQLPRVCDSKPDPSYRKDCQQLISDCHRLVGDLKESDIKFDSISAVLHLLRVSNIDLSSLSDESKKSKKSIKDMVANMHYDVHRNFKIDSLLAAVPALWTMLNSAVNTSLRIPIRQFQESKTVDDLSASFVRQWKYFFDATLAILVCLGVTALATCVTAAYVFGYKEVHRRKNRRKEAYNLNLVNLFNNTNSSTVPKPAAEGGGGSIPGVSHVLKVLTIFHLFLGGVMILPCIFASASFFIGGVLTTEVCRYLVESKGVSVLDTMIDPLIDSQWSSLTANINLSTTFLPVNLHQPQSPVRALYSTCASSNVSLISALNMSGIVDASQIVKLPMYTNMVSTGEAYVIKQVSALDLSSVIPTSLISFIDQGVDVLKRLIDPLSHKDSITALKKPILKMNVDQYAEFTKKFDLFLSRSDRSNPDVVGLTRIHETMKTQAQKYRSLTNDLKAMQNQFQVLEDTPVLAPKLLDLKASLLSTDKKLKDKQYGAQCVKVCYPQLVEKLTKSLVSEMTVFMRNFENSLFTCQPLHAGYSIMTRCVCGNIRSAIHSYTLSLVITIIWVQILFSFSWCLLSRLKPKIPFDDHSKC